MRALASRGRLGWWWENIQLRDRAAERLAKITLGYGFPTDWHTAPGCSPELVIFDAITAGCPAVDRMLRIYIAYVLADAEIPTRIDLIPVLFALGEAGRMDLFWRALVEARRQAGILDPIHAP